VQGIAVYIAARIASLAAASEILVSRTGLQDTMELYGCI
jgi:hypothetical protein